MEQFPLSFRIVRPAQLLKNVKAHVAKGLVFLVYATILHLYRHSGARKKENDASLMLQKS